MADVFRMNPPTSGGSSPPGGTSVTVATRHPDWLNFEPMWRRADHVVGGTDLVRSNARDYIPITESQKRLPELFDEAVARTPFTNFASRFVDGCLGLIFRKEPTAVVPKRCAARLDNIDHRGSGFSLFAKKIVKEVLLKGRVGILVDHIPADDQRNDDPLSRQPYLALYTAQNITNWRSRVINGRSVLGQVILHETYDIPLEFGSTTQDLYKVLELDEENFYRVRMYEYKESKREFVLTSEVFPTKNGKKLESIPFQFISHIDLSPAVQRPPALDVVDANISHYYREIEYSSALHFSANPTPVLENWPEGTPANYVLGAPNVWFTPQGCTAKILEFTGAALESLRQAVKDVETHIAELGGRFLQNVETAPETASAARIRQHSQTSVLGSLARTTADGLKAAMEILVDWAGESGKVEVELNQDYIDVVMDPQLFGQLITARNEGLMTVSDLVWNMQQAEMIQPGRTVEQVVAELEKQKPNFIGVPDPKVLLMPRRQAGAGTPPADGDAPAPDLPGRAPR